MDVVKAVIFLGIALIVGSLAMLLLPILFAIGTVLVVGGAIAFAVWFLWKLIQEDKKHR